LFISDFCSNLKYIQIQNLFKFRNCSDFEFVQILNYLKNKKPKNQPTSEQATKNIKQETEKPHEIQEKNDHICLNWT
jgi:hypothetical protein